MTRDDDPLQVLVIGTGASGCAAALAAAEAGLEVSLVTKPRDAAQSSTAHAQGGIIARGVDDSADLLARDITAAGDGLCDPEAVQVLAQEGPPLVDAMLVRRLDVPFSRDSDGELDYTQEAAHSTRRIIHSDDATGAAIEAQLIEAVKAEPRIRVLTNQTAVDLITVPHHSTDPLDVYVDNTCLGAYFLDNDTGLVAPLFAHHTVLATGGLGQIYLHTTNPPVARGDGLAMASRAGAQIVNAEYVQFHPTALYHRDADRFLISESVRGEGARLRTRQGDFFMAAYHPLGDLAPRDVVARAIHEEMLKNHDEYVLLDLSALQVDPEERFPTIHATCLRFGIDITREPIPVVPAAHYFCGGVKVDLWGHTDIRRLYAVGEVSCTGVHGANRLASTSLVEGLLWGTRAGGRIAEEFSPADAALFSHVADWLDVGLTEESDPALVIQDWMNIKSTMWNYAGIVRSNRRLARAWADLSYLHHRIEQFYRETKLTDNLVGLRNGLQAALIITDAARRNPHTRGCHYRTD